MARDGQEQAHNLSVNDLEAMLLARRRRQTVERVRRVADAEAHSDPRLALPSGSEPEPDAVRSPATRGPRADEEPYFRSLAPTPLGTDPAATGTPAKAPASARRRRKRDRWLLAFEIVAILGTLLFLGTSYLRLRELNRQTRAMQELVYEASLRGTETATAAAATASVATATAATAATLTPESIATATEIADTAGTATAGAAAAPETIVPASTETAVPLLPGWDRPARASVVVAPRNDPTPTPLLPTPMPEALRTQTMRRLVIPSIGVDGPIVAGDSWEDLKLGIGHHPGSANAGENGNVVLSAHDDVYGELFRYLYQVEPGAAVDIYGDEVVYHYQIRSVEIVAPTKIEVMAATTEPILTLITCYPYMLDTHRVVAVADYLGADPIEADAGDTGTTN